MARHRQRAKDRKKLQRDNVPGSLDLAGGVVDQVEARIVAGADGVPVDDADGGPSDGADRVAEPAATGGGDGDGGRGDGGAGDDAGDAGDSGAGDATTPPATRDQQGSRLVNFLRACWAELQRVQWPDRRQVGQATAVVLGFVVIAGAFLGLADIVAQRIVDLVL
jgi:preprotein translocase subunit SecE